MIRRTTPNKSFCLHDRSSSCCRWFAPDENKHEKTMTLLRKPLPAKFSNTNSTAAHPQEILEEKSYKTPVKANYVTRKSSDNSNQLTWPTARTQVKRETLITLITFPSSQAARNPLQRLQKLHKNKAKLTNTQRPSLQLTAASKPICFNYVTPRKQTFGRENWSTGSVTTKRTVQLQVNEQNQLKKQLDNYKKEYQELLNEYKQLQQNKQANLYIYKTLLTKLTAKKEEIMALEKLRKQEIQELQTQIEQLIAQRELA